MNKLPGALMLISAQIFASPCISSPGQTTCDGGSQHDLTAHGIANLFSTKFSGTVKVFGEFNSKNCKFTQLEVHGASNIESSKINSDFAAYGMLKMNGCYVGEQLNIFSNKAIVTDSNINSVNVNSNSQPELLLNNSIVHGDITFTSSSPGKVICTACNIKGKIKHGILTKPGEDNAQ